MSFYQCPICKLPLSKIENLYRCENNHCFDLAKQGYVNLLPCNKKHSKIPGDNNQMVVARREFLAAGYYQFLSCQINQILLDLAIQFHLSHPLVIDCGCGEGYYTRRLADFLIMNGLASNVLGFDISKSAVLNAAKQDHLAHYAVASIAELPVADSSADFMINIFAPVIPQEFFRVLKPGGIVLLVTPSETHLFGLKKLLYEQPYENIVKQFAFEGFEKIYNQTIIQNVTFTDSNVIANLFMMTPYYWKTSSGALEKISQTKQLKTPLGFNLQALRKI